ncbi:hypothetical protein B0H11DRAFT_2308329 [Mycena galericulata]|nr:hypothetical protein B0H11DRAFT_2308329 [Mycena galericulata]
MNWSSPLRPRVLRTTGNDTVLLYGGRFICEVGPESASVSVSRPASPPPLPPSESPVPQPGAATNPNMGQTAESGRQNCKTAPKTSTLFGASPGPEDLAAAAGLSIQISFPCPPPEMDPDHVLRIHSEPGPVGPNQIPRRAVVTSDWDRVLKYSARVKFFVSDRRPSMTTVYEAIKDTAPGEYLLPHLEHLSWRHQSAACWPFIGLFLGPCITSVELSVQRGGPHPLLATLAQRYPELRSVSIEGLNARSDPSERRQLSRFIPRP